MEAVDIIFLGTQCGMVSRISNTANHAHNKFPCSKMDTALVRESANIT